MPESDAVAPSYWAFISYSHHDQRIAEALKRRLQEQTVPRPMRARVAARSQRFEPVFLDIHTAAANRSLTAELQAALRASAKLIVLCSPFAVGSRYVSEEIAYFQGIGRDHDILCLVVSGVPDATGQGKPALECFPALLRQAADGDRSSPSSERPLAPQLGRETDAEWAHAVDQLCAGMLGVSFEALRQLRDRSLLRRVAGWAGGVSFAAALTAAALWAWWLPQESFAKGFVRRFGTWEAVDPISRSASANRELSYRFERRGAWGLLRAVYAVNGDGECAGDAVRSIVGDPFKFKCSRAQACGVRFKPQQEEVFDQYGNTLETLNYASPDRAILTDAVVGCSRRVGGIEFIELQRVSDGPNAGLDKRLLFRGGDDKQPRPNAEYAFGLAFDYDAKGRVVRRALLDEHGTVRIGAQGYSAQTFVYAADGELELLRHEGLHNEPVDSRAGYAALRRQVDVDGRGDVERYYDASGKPTYDENGIHGQRRSRAADGQQTIEMMGLDGKRSVDRNGISVVRRMLDRATKDEREAWFDEQDKPVVHAKEGCALVKTRVAVDERVGETRCFDGAGQPMLRSIGVHLVRTWYDARGNEIDSRFFGLDGKSPVYCTDSEWGCPVHRVRNEFDTSGNKVASRGLGTQDELVSGTDGHAGSNRTYDKRNRTVLEVNIGVDDKPTRVDGVTAVAVDYDAYGRIVEKRFVDENGKPSPSANGLYRIHVDHDESGNVRQSESFRLDGRRAADASGVAIWRAKYDSRGREIESRYFDTAEVPTRHKDGFFGYRLVLDAWGRDVEAQFLDAEGHPGARSDGVFIERGEMDRFGHLVRARYLAADRSPLLNNQGIAGFDDEVDVRGNVLARRHVGLLGQTVTDRDGLSGWRARYDARGKRTVYVRLGPGLQPIGSPEDAGVAIIVNAYDERGEESSVMLFDAAGRPLVNDAGVHGWVVRRNSRGLEIERRYVSISGVHAPDKDGVARVEFDYDNVGAKTQARFLDLNGQPTSAKQVPIVRYVNDLNGRELVRTFFDARGQPTVSPKSGRARVVSTRDTFGRLIEEASFDTVGKPVNRRDKGWARRTLRYDDSGELAEVLCFDIADQRVSPCEKEEE